MNRIQFLKKVAPLVIIAVIAACNLRVKRQPSQGWPLIFSKPDTTALVTYESRDWLSAGDFLLKLQADSSYTVTSLKDGTVVNRGRWELRGDSLCIQPDSLPSFDCSPRVTRHWLHDRNKVTGWPRWRENPLNENWPPQAPKDSTDA